MKVYPQYDSDTDLYVLMVSVPGMGPTPAGNRIFHIPPEMKPGAAPTWPQVRFSHVSPEDAERDAELIRKYLAQLKPTSKTAKYAA